MSIFVDFHCPQSHKACLSEVSLQGLPGIGHTFPLYEQTRWPDGETVNEEGEEAPDKLLGVFQVVEVETPLHRFGPGCGEGDRGYTRHPIVRLRPIMRLERFYL